MKLNIFVIVKHHLVVCLYFFRRFIFVGPTTHHFYIWLDQILPRTGRLSAVYRIILDRFVFAPPWLMVYFYMMALLEASF